MNRDLMILKKKNLLRFFSLLFLIILLTSCAISNDSAEKGRGMENKKRILLLGASVGKAWNLSEFPQRMKSDDIFETIAFYEYDKTEALDEILMRPKRKFHLTRTYIKGFFEPSPQLPDTIIIKECAAYFPGDLESYKESIKKWVKMIKDKKVDIILATTAPVTEERAKKRKGQIEAIREFNEWIRDYAKIEKITLLDLEAALRKEDATNRFLRDNLSIDGLHLNKEAYNILDRLLLDTLSK